MDTRIAVISIIVEDREAVDDLNHLLGDYGSYIIGRMGLPYTSKAGQLHIISIAMDAPQDVISSLAGKIGKLPKVSVKTALSNVIIHEA